MSTFTPIDLSRLPAPDVLEKVDYKTVLAEMLNDLRQRDPAFTALVESDPVIKLLEVVSFRDMLQRQRINDAARGVMLAFATGADLEHIGALFGVTRKIIMPGNTNSLPPTPTVVESDSDLRRRITLSLEGLSTAGPEGSYLYHALKHPHVRDASIVGPPAVLPGQVLVTILSYFKDGAVGENTINEVRALLNAEDVRPITDEVIVRAVKIQKFDVKATIFTDPGPDPRVVLNLAIEKARDFLTTNFRVGRDMPLSGIYASLHVPGVQRVVLTEPTQTISVDYTQAALSERISLIHGGVEK